MKIVIDTNISSPFIDKLNIIKPISKIKICRDKDDDKFIECALDSKATYIVSGDKDLLDIAFYKSMKIVTTKDLCNSFLHDNI